MINSSGFDFPIENQVKEPGSVACRMVTSGESPMWTGTNGTSRMAFPKPFMVVEAETAIHEIEVRKGQRN